jgi:excisionase family DNA binding protein
MERKSALASETAARDTYRPREVAPRLGVSIPTVYRWIERGELPSIRIGRAVLVPAEGLRLWIASRTTGGDGCAA